MWGKTQVQSLNCYAMKKKNFFKNNKSSQNGLIFYLN